MTDAPLRFQRTRKVLDEALALPREERESHVRAACGADEAMAAEVLDLLRQQDRLFEQPAWIGPYRILDELGRGAYGVVYRAERRDPVPMVVAIKVLHTGIASRDVLSRFEMERRVLAAMQHRCIAKVHDAGTTELGLPYVVMELVEGLPIDQYCERHRLSVEERLRLFQQVCEGVQHAHLKGVVHRDLKPGNVLVVREGERHVPKVVDFGLAKALHRDAFGVEHHTGRDIAVGTLEYMSPEQAAGAREAIDARSDVYSLGVMLYQLLCDELPFPSKRLREAAESEARRIVQEEEPPRPSARLRSRPDSGTVAAQRQSTSGALQRTLQTDLDWVVLKALAKEPERRYDAATTLAADLERYLNHEPVVAGPPSASYRLKKLLRRYRVQLAAASAVVAASLAFGTVAVVQYVRAEQSTREAREQEQRARDLAKSEEAAKEQFASKVRDFNQLSVVVRLKGAQAAQAAMWLSEDDSKGWPAKIEALEHWLTGPCKELLAQRPQLEATVAVLRQQALTITAEQIEADRRASPAYEEYGQQMQLVAGLRRAAAIRSGTLELELPELRESLRTADAKVLNEFARARVAPEQDGDESVRTVLGEEAEALVAARAAVAGSAGQPDACIHLDTLAWALLANGQDAQATQRSAEALAMAPAEQRAEYERYQRALAAAIEASSAQLQAAEARLAELEAVVNERRTWTFASDTEGETSGFLHGVLVEQLRVLLELEVKEKADVEHRLAWAKQVGAATAANPQARHTWAAVQEALAKADGVVASTLYAGRPIVVPEQGWVGLVPIGMNPVTKLWEFYDLRSAWDGKQAATDIVIPVHREDGTIEVTESTGIVFVLLPGGTVTLGSQDQDPQAPFYVQDLRNHVDLHHAVLDPFLLSRYELTQGQWSRLQTWDEDLSLPSTYRVGGDNHVGGQITGLHPVEHVDWHMSVELLSRYGLRLPSEDEWEYGCRGGTTTPWHVPLAELQTVANLSDQTAKKADTPSSGFESWEDGHEVHAPVGRFGANAFGLHDMHGNVAEWCRDAYQVSAGDPIHVYRGGSFFNEAGHSQSTSRYGNVPSSRSAILGLRAARTLRL